MSNLLQSMPLGTVSIRKSAGCRKAESVHGLLTSHLILVCGLPLGLLKADQTRTYVLPSLHGSFEIAFSVNTCFSTNDCSDELRIARCILLPLSGFVEVFQRRNRWRSASSSGLKSDCTRWTYTAFATPCRRRERR